MAFYKKNQTTNQTTELSKAMGYNPMKIFFLSWSIKNAILTTFSEERGRFHSSPVYNRECIDKDLVRLTSLNIHPRKVLMI